MKFFEHLRAQRLDVGDRLHVFAHDGEFVAAEARAERLAQHAVQAQPLADRLQHAVAERVTEAVVDRLEVVEVDRQQREPRIVALGAIDGSLQMHEQLPAVRQIGERIVVREVIQLARALVDLRFQLDLVGAHRALRVLQLFGHLVECNSQHVQLTHARSRYARAHRTAGQTTSRVDQPPHRRGHAGHGDDRDHHQQQHDRGARPNQLPVGLVGGAHRQAVGVSKRAPSWLDQLRHDQRGDLRALVPEHHRTVVEIVDGVECCATASDDGPEFTGHVCQPLLAMHLRELRGVLLQEELEVVFGQHDALHRAGRRYARGRAHTLADRAEHAREIHEPFAREHRAGNAHSARVRSVHAGLQLVEVPPVLVQTRAARSAVGEHLFAHRPERVQLGNELRRRGRELREILGGFVVSGRRIGHALRRELRLVHRDRIAFRLIDHDALIKRHGGGQCLGGAYQRLVLHEQLAHASAGLAGALLSDEIRGNDGERDCGKADRDAQRHAGAISAGFALVRHRLLAVDLSCLSG